MPRDFDAAAVIRKQRDDRAEHIMQAVRSAGPIVRDE
jgi:hypothetical protein